MKIVSLNAWGGRLFEEMSRWLAEEQPDILAIVRGWRYDIQPSKALKLGLTADESFEDNIRYYLEDDKPAA